VTRVATGSVGSWYGRVWAAAMVGATSPTPALARVAITIWSAVPRARTRADAGTILRIMKFLGSGGLTPEDGEYEARAAIAEHENRDNFRILGSRSWAAASGGPTR
jgi:hypothetical protein